jgi:hypothetical protein
MVITALSPVMQLNHRPPVHACAASMPSTRFDERLPDRVISAVY